MYFFALAIFTTLLGSVAAAPAELGARQEANANAVVFCVDGTFADPVVSIPEAVCKSTYGCEGGSQPVKSGDSWTGSCYACPPDQNVNKFGNCVLSYIRT
ncbi:hypothetical protein NM208_g9273 [Fusarium decemcellulare]|uniref:Uncharacterized protein n=1 Tax=Fusarium decemcellulare TaxID=57161 RepID=A0ACC1S2I6_9HYPO|nr:hypothetical protein NM208_g9273 [Fusarium decemcellulare]